MRLRYAALALSLATVAYFALILLVQRSLLFPRPPRPLGTTRPADASQLWLDTSVGPVEAWYLPPLGATSARAPVIIFFHGNAELIDFVAGDFEAPRRWGCGILLVEFPGYGRSAGSPSQAGVTSAALAAYDWARAQPTIEATHIVTYGRSLGGGAAATLAANRPVAALVLESAFTSVKSFAHRFGVPAFAVLDSFDNLAAVRSYSGPVLILHGEHDEIVPPAHGAALAAAAHRPEVHFLPCGHNDCERPWSIIRAFLMANGFPLWRSGQYMP